MSTAYCKNMQTELKYIFKRAYPYFSLSVSYDMSSNSYWNENNKCFNSPWTWNIKIQLKSYEHLAGKHFPVSL